MQGFTAYGATEVELPQAAVAPLLFGSVTPATEEKVFYLIVFPQTFEDEVIAILDQLGVPGFTEHHKVTGRGPRGRHYDSLVWPGADAAIFTVVTGDQVASLATALADYNRRCEAGSRGLYGVRVFRWGCQQVA